MMTTPHKPKICSDCKWHDESSSVVDLGGTVDYFHICKSHTISTIDLVTGKTRDPVLVPDSSCFENRSKNSAFCGPEGRNFEAKETPKP